MTALAWGALLVGLACVPISDPESRRWLRARLRLRRCKRAKRGVLRAVRARRRGCNILLGRIAAAELLRVGTQDVAQVMARADAPAHRIPGRGELGWRESDVRAEAQARAARYKRAK